MLITKELKNVPRSFIHRNCCKTAALAQGTGKHRTSWSFTTWKVNAGSRHWTPELNFCLSFVGLSAAYVWCIFVMSDSVWDDFSDTRVFNLLPQCSYLVNSATAWCLQSTSISNTSVTCTPPCRGVSGGESPAWHVTEDLGETHRSRTRRPWNTFIETTWFKSFPLK